MQALAEQLGICDDVAGEKAAFWGGLALPLTSYFECAKAAASSHVPIKPPPTPRGKEVGPGAGGGAPCTQPCAQGGVKEVLGCAKASGRMLRT